MESERKPEGRITLQEALALPNAVFVDVRTPAEFGEGQIYGAVNIPLFSDEERVIVGTIYKHEGKEKARETGFALVAPRLPEMVQKIKLLADSGQKVIISCWRGGMRSRAVTDLLKIVGVEAWQLEGGYKNYRRYVLDRLKNFDFKPEIIMLCGSTGTGKTQLLKLLENMGLPVIDLEALAHHRGSVFGHIGIKEPSRAQEFDARLLYLLDKFNDGPYILVECESKRIGSVYLPEVLYRAMQNGRKILLSADMDVRIERLAREYLQVYKENKIEIIEKLEHLRKRLGHKKTDNLLILLKQDNIKETVKILLTEYYDPLYGYEREDKFHFARHIGADDLTEAANQIAAYISDIKSQEGD